MMFSSDLTENLKRLLLRNVLLEYVVAVYQVVWSSRKEVESNQPGAKSALQPDLAGTKIYLAACIPFYDFMS